MSGLRELEERVEEKEEWAKEEDISAKAKRIAEILGEEFSESIMSYGPNGRRPISKEGCCYSDEDIIIQSYTDQDKSVHTKISIVNWGRWFILRTKTTEEVYCEIEDGLETQLLSCKREERFVPLVEGLYAKSIGVKALRNEERNRKHEREKIKTLEYNFDL